MIDIREVSYEEGRHILDAHARRDLGMSGDAFLAAFDAGELGHLDCCAVAGVEMLIPFVRDVPSRREANDRR